MVLTTARYCKVLTLSIFFCHFLGEGADEMETASGGCMYKCPCPEGYTNEAETKCTLDYTQEEPTITRKEQFGQCEDIDECRDKDTCQGNRTCKNTDGGYICHPENIPVTCDSFVTLANNNVVVPSTPPNVFIECQLSWMQSECNFSFSRCWINGAFIFSQKIQSYAS